MSADRPPTACGASARSLAPPRLGPPTPAPQAPVWTDLWTPLCTHARMSCVDVGDILLTTVGESSGRAPDLDGPGPPPVDGRTVVADLERSGIPAARCGPQWAGVSALKPVAVAVVPATQPATNPDFGRPGRPGRWMGGSHDGGSPYPLRPRTRAGQWWRPPPGPAHLARTGGRLDRAAGR